MSGDQTTGEVSQTDRAIEALRRLIFKGDYGAGARLTELELVARLGVSRTPVRHALAHLAVQGLLQPLPTGGFRVRAFAIEDVWDAIDLRAVLEGTAVRLAAERFAHADALNAARQLIDRMSAALEARNIDDYFSLNGAFHTALWEAAKSPPLVRTIQDTMRLPFAAPSAVLLESRRASTLFDRAVICNREHLEILHAIESREGMRADALMREHVLVWRRSLESLLEDQDRFTALPGASLLTPRAG